jgi:uncharacterized protein YdhG (YjbR/CyaY superfamily)
MPQFAHVDVYIASFPAYVQECLQQVRHVVLAEAPEAEETIKYNMPCYVLHGNLVYFAAFKKHIGFFSTGAGDPDIDTALQGYTTGRGSVQFPYTKPMPLSLIAQIVRYRVAQNKAKTGNTSMP